MESTRAPASPRTGFPLVRNSLARGARHFPGDVLGGERLDLHRVAKIGQAFDSAVFLLVGGTAIEVIGARVTCTSSHP